MDVPVGAGLESYAAFSPQIVNSLNDVAARLGNLSYHEAVAAFKVPEPELFRPDAYKPIEVLDCIPPSGYDQTLVLQTEATTGIDPNTVMHMIPLLGSLPTTRLIVHGKPTMWGNRNNLLTRAQAKQVAQGDFSPMVIPTLQYLRTNRHKRVEHATHAGFSLGADLVTEIPRYAESFEHMVTAIISADGVTSTARSVCRLGRDFVNVQKEWQAYMNQVKNPAYREARRIGHNDNFLAVTAFLRRSNIAITRGLARGGMEHRLELALARNPLMKAIILNCANSELTNSAIVDDMRQRLRGQFGERVRGDTLPNMTHAVNDQIYGNAAIILHGLALATA